MLRVRERMKSRTDPHARNVFDLMNVFSQAYVVLPTPEVKEASSVPFHWFSVVMVARK